MAEELIDSYVDRAGVKGDTDYMVALLREVHGEFKKLEAVKLDLKGATGLTQSLPAMNQAKTGMDSLAIATKAVEERIAQMNGKSKEFTDLLLKQAKAEKEAAAAAVNTAKAANEAAKGKLAEAKAANEALKTKEKETKAAEQTAKASERSAKAKEIEARLEKKLLAEKEKLNRERIKEEERLAKNVNAYEQLKQKYTIAANAAKALAAAKGLDNEETKEALKVAGQYYKSLIEIEKAVGQNQRNVGNYTQATFALTQVLREAPAFANSMATGISAISNNVPQLVDQFKLLREETGSNFKAFKILASSLFSFQALLPLGFLLLQSYSKEIGNFFSGLFKGAGAFNAAKEAQKDFNAAMQEASGSIGKEVGELKALYDISQDVTQSTDDRKDASKRILQIVKDNNEATGESVKLLTDQNGILKAQPELIDKVSESLLRQAKTKAALQLVEKAYGKVLEAQLATLTSQTNALQDVATKGLNLIDDFFGGGRVPSVTEVQKGIKEKGELDAQAYLTAVQKILAEGLKSGELDFGGVFDFDKGKKDKTGEAARKAAFENIKQLLEDEMAIQKRIVEIDTFSSVERIAALRKYTDIKKQLIEAEAAFELKKTGITADEINAINTKKVISLKQAGEELLSLFKDVSEKTVEEAVEALTELTEEEQAILNKNNQAFADSVKQFLGQLTEAQKKAVSKIEEAFKLDKQKQELVFTYIDAFQQIATAGSQIFSSFYENQKNELQEQIDLIEERKQAEIEAAGQTITSAQERAAAIAIIEARAAAERDAIARKQRQIDQKKAEAAKALNIFQITADGLQSFAKQKLIIAEIVAKMAAAGPLGPVLYGPSLAIAKANLLTSVAANFASLAAAVAQPIPRYKHGKNVNDLYEGPAIVGDGGRKEAIIRESGQVEITPDTPTLTYVGKRDIVLPDTAMLSNLVVSGKMGGKLVERTAVIENSNVEAAIKEMKRDVVGAIKKIPQPVISVSNVISQRVYHGDSSNQYLNKNLQG